jgi:hypothetical protein
MGEHRAANFDVSTTLELHSHGVGKERIADTGWRQHWAATSASAIEGLWYLGLPWQLTCDRWHGDAIQPDLGESTHRH